MAEYYAVTRSGAHLSHYGIKGMKWRVRKAVGKGDERAYNKALRKANKKIARLERQARNGRKYAQKAILNSSKVAATGGAVMLGFGNPGVLAFNAARAGYNAYRANNTKSAEKRAKAWKEAVESVIDPGGLYEAQMARFRRHRRKNRGKNFE